jgi:hypothetical protein
MLIIIVILLSIILYYSLKKNIQAGQQLLLYDEFFNSSLNDVQEVIIYLDKLSKRELVSQDPDIITLKKTIVILKNILIGYTRGIMYDEETTSKN